MTATQIHTQSNRPVPILCYHSIADNELSLSPQAFRRQLRYLMARRYQTITVGELALRYQSGNLPERTVCITFDDCFESVFWHAVPVLEDFGFTATCFAVVDYIGSTLWGIPAARRWRRLPQPGDIAFRMMDWDQIKDVQRRGFEIGSHTVTHRNLTDIPAHEALHEIAASKHLLEQQLNTPVVSFAYPRGRHHEEIVRQVRKSGYRAGCTTRYGCVSGSSNEWALPRIPGPSLICDLIRSVENVNQHRLVTWMMKGLAVGERAAVHLARRCPAI